MKYKYYIGSLVLLLSVACQQPKSNKASENTSEEIGLNLKNMDTTVRPQDDFYNYVNGAWMKKTEIPADRSRWGSFDELRKKTDQN
ncbi:MAG TPA: M13 family peptidase, partial [Flavobacteriales bacterium]|nr:M13 family peptidase [Flavobacteriales bacterium]